MRTIGKPHGAGGPADFLHRDDVRQVPELRAAVSSIDGDAEQPEFAELGPQVSREFVVAVDIRGQRRHSIPGKTAYRFAQQIEIVAVTKIKFEHAESHRHKRFPILTSADARLNTNRAVRRAAL